MLHTEGWHYKETKNSRQPAHFCKAKEESEEQNERRKELFQTQASSRVFSIVRSQHIRIAFKQSNLFTSKVFQHVNWNVEVTIRRIQYFATTPSSFWQSARRSDEKRSFNGRVIANDKQISLHAPRLGRCPWGTCFMATISIWTHQKWLCLFP